MRVGFKVLILFLFTNSVFSQIPIGQWRVHLPYSNGLNIEVDGDKIYCLTTGGLFLYNNSDNSTKTITRIDGLSDVVISTIKFIPEKSSLIIGYANGNIDIIKDNVIYNIADIYRKPITGSKSINNIDEVEGKIYLSCGFGIVVLDLEKIEIKDTYFIGHNGTYINVMNVCADNNHLYAATSAGIYKALKDDPNLVNFANWTRITNINNSSKEFSFITFFDNKLFAVYNDQSNKDTLYVNSGNSWSVFDTTLNIISNLGISNNKLIVVGNGFVKTFDPATFITTVFYSNNSSLYLQARDAKFSTDNTLWIADYSAGLVWSRQGSNFYQYTHPNGPASFNGISVASGGDQTWVVPGGRNSSWGSLWMPGEIYCLKDEKWINYSQNQVTELAQVPDMCEIAINPKNSKQVYFGSYAGGVIEFNDGNYVAHYSENNSPLQSIIPGQLYVKIGGMAVDEDENLWVTSCMVENSLCVKKTNGQWKAYALGNDMGANLIGKVVAAKNGIKWMILVKGRGLFAFNENGTIDNESDDKKKYISVIDENGDVISNEIFSIAEDNEGLIWVGTNKGVVFYYNPENVFDQTNFYAQQIKIPNENPGQANYLLEAETVTAIAVDGANRKWFGTESGGVFLMSADGTKEILHFTTDNSPLLSNSIVSIAIDPNSGEVFISTTKGVISYRSTATAGQEYFHDVYAFPNPVKSGYNGVIAIKGLISNAHIKITDIVGNLVFSTTSEGGQAIWDGKDFSGRKVQTGVYIVFCSNDDGTKKYITKILFIN